LDLVYLTIRSIDGSPFWRANLERESIEIVAINIGDILISVCSPQMLLEPAREQVRPNRASDGVANSAADGRHGEEHGGCHCYVAVTCCCLKTYLGGNVDGAASKASKDLSKNNLHVGRVGASEGNHEAIAKDVDGDAAHHGPFVVAGVFDDKGDNDGDGGRGKGKDIGNVSGGFGA